MGGVKVLVAAPMFLPSHLVTSGAFRCVLLGLKFLYYGLNLFSATMECSFQIE